jgi:hypothetical protein
MNLSIEQDECIPLLRTFIHAVQVYGWPSEFRRTEGRRGFKNYILFM